MKYLSNLLEGYKALSKSDINAIKKYAKRMDDVALMKYQKYLKNNEDEELKESVLKKFFRKNKQKDLMSKISKKKKDLMADINSVDEFLKLQKIQRSNPNLRK